MVDDAELLRRYREDRSEDAFRELVERNLALVYHAALRHCGDVHLAQEAAQSVFTDLARKARLLASRPVLAGWLYTSARYAALRLMRTENRRLARETRAQAERELLEGSGAAGDWERLRPVIDLALQELGDRDREAVLLRFFEGKPFAEIGRCYALGEDAARMRVDRALEKMRLTLERNGIVSASTVLAAAMAGQASAAVPAGAAAEIAAAATLASPPAAAITLMTMTKLKMGVAAAVALLGAAGLVLQHRTNAALKAEVAGLRQRAEFEARQRAEKTDRDPAGGPAGQGVPAATAVVPRAAGPSADPRQVVPLANGLIPVSTLGNTGRSTPRDAFATQLWAARTGDIDLEASALTFGAPARAKLEALEATLPDAMRAEYDTPEKLMAYMLAGSPHPVGGMEVLGEVDVDANDATLQTEWQHVDDDVVHHSDVNLQNGPDGWKMVVPISLVNRASAYLTYTLRASAAAPPGN